MREIERKAWSETASLYLQRSKPQLQEIAASLVGFGDILSNDTLASLGKELFHLSVQLGEATPPMGDTSVSEAQGNDPEESEATLSLVRGISLAQSSEDLKRCADVLRGWHLPKGHKTLRRFSRMLLARAEELGLDPRKAQESPREPGCDDGIDQSPPELFNGYPRITNPIRAQKTKQLNTEKSRREVFESLVKTGKLGLPESDHSSIDDIAAQLLFCRSAKDIEAVTRTLSTFDLSSDAKQQVADLVEMRVGHIAEASWGGEP